MSLKKKFLIIGASASFLMILIAISSLFGARVFTGLLVETEVASTALRNHMFGDMMHDGLRSDVYRALHASQNAPGTRSEVEADVEEHANLFRERIAANKQLDLPQDVKTVLAALDEPLETYIRMAQLIVQDAFSDRAKALAELPEFDTRFTELEDAMEQASEAIGAAMKNATDHAHGISGVSEIAVAFILLLSVIVGAALTYYMWRFMAVPIATIADTIRRLADGDTDVDMESADRKDEIGAMTRAVEVFRDNAVERMRLEVQAREEREREASRQAHISKVIEDFRKEVSEIGAKLDGETQRMRGTADTLYNVSEAATGQASQARHATLEATTNVQAVSAAAEQMSASIRDISSQTSHVSSLAGDASARAEAAGTAIDTLSQTASRIGDVVEMIRNIAEQTNLLALNATIEAARAGDSGKGFAVVAQEVKQLSEETAKATDEIAEQVGSVQQSTGNAVDAIRSIVDSIAEVTNTAATVASAVSQQEAATQEITRNISVASDESTKSATNVTAVSEAIQEANSESLQVRTASEQLGNVTEELTRAVEQFLENVSVDIRERRSALRVYSDEEIHLIIGAAKHHSRLVDMSDVGARVLCVEGLHPGQQVQIERNGKPPTSARCVWVRDGSAGLEFSARQSASAA